MKFLTVKEISTINESKHTIDNILYILIRFFFFYFNMKGNRLYSCENNEKFPDIIISIFWK